MTDSMERQIRRVEDRLQMTAGEAFDRSVNKTLKIIEKKMAVLQQKFFTMLVMKTVGAKGPPKLGEYTPMWKPLSEAYTDRRSFDRDIDEDEFFNYSGKLGATLSRLNATTFFGKPLVVYNRGSFKQKAMKQYQKPDPRKQSGNLTARITVDLFPKIAGSINDIDEADLFNKVKITEKRGRKSKTTPISYRLKNYQGSRDRPVVVAYMNWWLNVQARKLVREAAR